MFKYDPILGFCGIGGLGNWKIRGLGDKILSCVYREVQPNADRDAKKGFGGRPNANIGEKG